MRASERGSALTDVVTLLFLWLPLLLAWGLAWHRQTLDQDTPFLFVSGVLLALYLLCVVWLLLKWLRLSRLNRLPWYLVVGPPGAGKTTLLKGSGLPWEYAAPTAPRILDAFFTGRSIVLNDVGGYVLHSDDGSPPSIQRELQKHLIRYLGERQPRAVLVTLPLDGSGDGPEAEEQRARSLRTLVAEVVDGVGINPPVFLVFTKCDQLPGFAQFAGHLAPAERDLSWGASLTAEQQRQPREAFLAECGALSRALGQRVLRSMEPGQTAENRAAYSFPTAFRWACSARADFVSTFFARSPDREPLLFRGFCFVSCAPEISPANGALANGALANGTEGATGGARSYFVTGLLTDDLSAPGVPPRPTAAVVRRRWMRRIVLSACSCAAGVALLLIFAPEFTRPLW